jgi:spore germination protein YaaH
MPLRGPLRLGAAALGICLVATGSGPAPVATAAASGSAVMPFRAHVYFDDTTGPPPAGIVRGAPASPLTHPKIPLAGAASAAVPAAATSGQSGAGAPTDPEILGFVQYGEVLSGAWAADLHFNQLSTISYFGVNVNPNATLVTSDAGYTTWWSSAETNLINAAHNAGDRVVLTVKAFNDSVIASSTGTETARQMLISGIINEVVRRPADGVNIDYEGVSSSLSANFTTFITELHSALLARAVGRSYLTVDTYASAGLGGTMYDLASLWPHVDALDLMGYGFEPCIPGHAGPSAPMGGCWYNVARAVSDYMTNYGVPASKLLLGVPYYGYKWDVSCASGCNGQDPTTSGGTADTYSAVLSDFGCAQSLQKHRDATFQGPWASWYSPTTNDPCGGNHGSFRELYYDDAQSLGLKYDLVNSRGLRGIAIWALGYDSGTNDLWNEIAAKFTVSKFPPFKPASVGAPSVAVLPNGSQQLVFWKGASNHLFEGWYSGGYWHGPSDLTGILGPSATLQSAPSVAVTPDGSTQTVFWQGPGSHLFEAWWALGRWNGPMDITAGSLGSSAVLASAPSVAITPDGSTQTVFWDGPGGHLVEAWWAAGRWNGPVDWTRTAFRGAGTLASAPSAAVMPDGSQQTVFWQGAGGHLVEAWWAGGRWNGPVDWTATAFGGADALASSPSATMLPNGSQQLVFWTGAGGHLLQAWWAGGRWNGPVDWTGAAFGGAAILTSPPSATVLPDGTQQLVFWQGAGSTLWEGWYALGHWNGPVNLSAG